MYAQKLSERRLSSQRELEETRRYDRWKPVMIARTRAAYGEVMQSADNLLGFFDVEHSPGNQVRASNKISVKRLRATVKPN